jgi:uncharacterized UBP type Zn finger protein
MWREDDDPISPRAFVQEVKQHNALFQGYSQQDSMEFLRYVLERLHEGQKDGDNSSIISDIFGGTLESSVKCLSCNYVRLFIHFYSGFDYKGYVFRSTYRIDTNGGDTSVVQEYNHKYS